MRIVNYDLSQITLLLSSMVAVEYAVAVLANLVNTDQGRRGAIAASTGSFMLNLIEVGVYVFDFKPAEMVRVFSNDNEMYTLFKDSIIVFQCLRHLRSHEFTIPTTHPFTMEYSIQDTTIFPSWNMIKQNARHCACWSICPNLMTDRFIYLKATSSSRL
jgi:hypothetical protein